jgi:hypothetical protein
MNYSTVILGVVLAFFGILFLLLIVYIIKSNKAKSGLIGKSTKMPPLDYMREIGSKCPDYWVYKGADPNPAKPGYSICENVFNIPTQASRKDASGNLVCYDDSAARIKSFKNAAMTADGKMDPEAEKQRCNFVTQCGPTSEMKASWLGVSSEQMSPGYVNCGLV